MGVLTVISRGRELYRLAEQHGIPPAVAAPQAPPHAQRGVYTAAHPPVRAGYASSPDGDGDGDEDRGKGGTSTGRTLIVVLPMTAGLVGAVVFVCYVRSYTSFGSCSGGYEPIRDASRELPLQSSIALSHSVAIPDTRVARERALLEVLGS